jgi:type II secretory pathway pseudopilin PulG
MEREAGFSLIETLLGAAIAAIVLWALVATVSRLALGSAAADRRVNAIANASRLLERLAADAASAQSITANPNGTEVDFVAQDGAHRTYAWSYAFNAANGTVTRSTGDLYSAVDGFTVSAVAAGDLSNAASPAYDPLFASASAPSVAGNALVAVNLTAAGVQQEALLATPDAPTAFTVVVLYTPSPTPLVTATPAPLSLTTP